jgi:hypothetical protein
MQHKYSSEWSWNLLEQPVLAIIRGWNLQDVPKYEAFHAIRTALRSGRLETFTVNLDNQSTRNITYAAKHFAIAGDECSLLLDYCVAYAGEILHRIKFRNRHNHPFSQEYLDDINPHGFGRILAQIVGDVHVDERVNAGFFNEEILIYWARVQLWKMNKTATEIGTGLLEGLGDMGMVPADKLLTLFYEPYKMRELLMFLEGFLEQWGDKGYKL